MSLFCQDFKCKICSTLVRSNSDGDNSILLHVLLKNHVEYDVESSQKGTYKRVCCLHCQNPNVMILGYCFNLQDYLCIDCLGKKSVFKDFTDWRNAYSSWFPLIFSKSLVTHMDSVPNEYSCERPKNSDYPLALNASYLHQLKKNLSSEPCIGITLKGRFYGSSEYCCCFMITVPETQVKTYSVGSCYSLRVTVNDFPQDFDAVVVATEVNHVIFTVLNTSSSTFIKIQECTLTPFSLSWPTITPLVACGRLLQKTDINSMLLGYITGRSSNGLFRNVKLDCYDRVFPTEKEIQTLDRCIKTQCSILECGENGKREAGTISFIFVKYRIGSSYCNLYQQNEEQTCYICGYE